MLYDRFWVRAPVDNLTGAKSPDIFVWLQDKRVVHDGPPGCLGENPVRAVLNFLAVRLSWISRTS